MADYWSAAASVAGALGGASIANQGSKDAQVKSIDYDYLMRDIGPWMQQRALKKAGLNPILAVNPSAMQNSAFPPTYTGAQPHFGDAASALEVDSKIKEREANIEKISAEISAIEQTKMLQQSQITKVAHEIDNIMQDTRLTIEQVKAQQYDNVQGKALADFFSQYEWARVAKELNIDARLLKVIIFKFFGERVVNITNKFGR